MLPIELFTIECTKYSEDVHSNRNEVNEFISQFSLRLGIDAYLESSKPNIVYDYVVQQY